MKARPVLLAAIFPFLLALESQSGDDSHAQAAAPAARRPQSDTASGGNQAEIQQLFYFNNPGNGYFTPSLLSPQLPAPAAPLPASIGKPDRLGVLSARQGYYRACSGYYYPLYPAVYAPAPGAAPSQAIYAIVCGRLIEANPPLTQVVADLRDFLKEAQGKNRIDQTQCKRLEIKLGALEQTTKERFQHKCPQAEANSERLRDLFSQIRRAVNP